MMSAQAKYWVCKAAWILFCILMVGTNRALAHDGSPAEDDAMMYWATTLQGARMSPSVRAMVSPLSSHDICEFIKDITNASTGGYQPVHAAAFCKAARIQCELGNLQSQVQTQGTAAQSFSLNVPLEKMNAKKAARILTASGFDGELHGIYFREKQVLVSGINIRESYESYEAGDADVDKASGRAFLPRRLAELFPLRGDGANIISVLGVPSDEVQDVLRVCKRAEARGCAISIEELADFVWSVLGGAAARAPAGRSNGIVMYESVTNASHVAGDTFYVVVKVEVLTADMKEPSVTCHDVTFPFRVFFCQDVKQSKVFHVTLQGENGNTHQRTAVCHYDTSAWSPTHQAFQELHTKPGESEVCYWLGGRSLRQVGWAFVAGSTAV